MTVVVLFFGRIVIESSKLKPLFLAHGNGVVMCVEISVYGTGGVTRVLWYGAIK